MTEIKPSMMSHALNAAARGFFVFPAVPGKKSPLVKWGTEEPASIDTAQIVAWWTKWPDANVAIATKPSGLVVIDTDLAKPGEMAPEKWAEEGVNDGEDMLALLAEQNGDGNFDWLNTYTVRTPSSGIHRYYQKHPLLDIRNSQPIYGTWAVDVRAGGADIAGGIAFAAGSKNLEGKEYTVILDIPIRPIDDWMAVVCMRRPPMAQPTPAQSRPPEPFSKQSDTIARLVGWMASVPQGKHSAGVYWSACEMRDADVSQDQAVDAIMAGTQQWPDSRHGWDYNRVNTAVKSAYSRPKRATRYG